MGGGEMNPFSDVDITFFHHGGRPTEEMEQPTQGVRQGQSTGVNRGGIEGEFAGDGANAVGTKEGAGGGYAHALNSWVACAKSILGLRVWRSQWIQRSW